MIGCFHCSRKVETYPVLRIDVCDLRLDRANKIKQFLNQSPSVYYVLTIPPKIRTDDVLIFYVNFLL